jgi:hypothetical protein
MNQSSSAINCTIEERDQKLIEYVAERHLEPGGLKERHVRAILSERLYSGGDFEKDVWPKFLAAVERFKNELVSLC